MVITHKIKMDLSRRGITPVVYMVQGDSNTRALEILLYDNGQPWEIPAGATAAVAFQKPDGTKGLYDKLPNGSAATTISGSTVTAILAPQALTCAGTVLASVVFYDKDMDTLATFPFKITVEANPAAGEQVSNNYYALQNFDQINAAFIALDARVVKLENEAPSGGSSGGSGGSAVAVGVEPAEDDIPKVFFDGDITDMSKENEKVLAISYRSKTESFDGFVKMKWQGSSSIHFAKKNYTIKLYEDEALETKKKVDMRGWGKQNKFCLKANFVDITHARNIVSARLWSQIVASRPFLDRAAFMTNSPNNGAIDGFPIKLYLNGKYEGLYTWNIPKDAWMFAMDEDNPDHCVLCAEQNNNGDNTLALASEFRAEAKLDESDWSVEVPSAATDEVKAGFNRLISFVMTATDEEFKASLGSYANVQSLIDYFCFMIASCANDNAAKNILMATASVK